MTRVKAAARRMRQSAAMASRPLPEPHETPYDRIGRVGVRAIVERFYDRMDGDPAYAGLRAMHGADLAPMRASLAGFLTAWLGGPRDWFAEHPGTCIPSLHRGLGVSGETAVQWADCMARAIADQPGLDPALGLQMAETLARMCRVMAMQAEQSAR